MICDFCHEREAVIFLEQVNNNGQKRKINMCMECAIERGISDDPKSIESSIGELFKEISLATQRLQADSARACPVCGTSIGQIRKRGIIGCPECYSIFKAGIKKILEHNGRKCSYTGSLPERLSTEHSALSDRVNLQKKMEHAVQNEDYEKAALYRDFIRALENVDIPDENQIVSSAKNGEDCDA
ncbi:MAG TPA: DNA helicase UvrBC [Treponema sp.]|nr:DNA helicase UvrBC [Treponema sp.]HBB43434.1 DNA helicase UvrBC [Treponema sp.]